MNRIKKLLIVFLTAMTFGLSANAASASYIVLKSGYLPGMTTKAELLHGFNQAMMEALEECKSNGGVLTKTKKLHDQNAIVAGLCVLKE